MAQPPEPTARLEILFARQAPVGVIFRRGPKHLLRLILWHTDTDVFEPGQWIKAGIRNGVDLSPNGKLLVYSTRDYRPGRGDMQVGPGWVAVSRPPYLTAIGLWSLYPSYVGGGIFLDNHTLELSGTDKSHRSLPEGFLAFDPFTHRGERPAVRPVPAYQHWPWSQGGWTLAHEPRYPTVVLEHQSSGARVELRADRSYVDPGRRLILVRGGKLLAVELVDDHTAVERELADFTDMIFQAIPPPDWATQWP